ncbi:hypothetical protein NKI98_26850 [Mesorhizobium sp. M0222]|uniref:hypothetical protein n=1 Tax=Mesorhizobium sp. M0222 TaxID=2956921 RepID=UPI0033350BB0
MSVVEKELRQQIGLSRQAEHHHRRCAGDFATCPEAVAFAAALLFCAAITIGLV